MNGRRPGRLPKIHFFSAGYFIIASFSGAPMAPMAPIASGAAFAIGAGGYGDAGTPKQSMDIHHSR